MSARWLIIVLLLSMFSACATSDPAHNPNSGLNHSLVRRIGAMEWSATGADSKAPSGVLFRAPGVSRGTFICLHGIQTHAAWFAPLARELTKAGWNVIAMDRRGSGANTAQPFTKGDARGADELLNDLRLQIASADREFGQPIYLLGTSWGSNTAAAYAGREESPRIKGLILLVPATRSRFENGVNAALARMGGALGLRLKTKLPFGAEHYQPGASQPTPTDQPQPLVGKPSKGEVTRPSEDIRQLLAQDSCEKVLVEKPSLRLVSAGLQMATMWRESPRKLQIPLLVIVAQRDQIMDNGVAWQAARHSAAHPTLEEIPGAGHGAQITHPRDIAQRITKWIAGH